MRKSRFSDAETLGILRQAEEGLAICLTHSCRSSAPTISETQAMVPLQSEMLERFGSGVEMAHGSSPGQVLLPAGRSVFVRCWQS